MYFRKCGELTQTELYREIEKNGLDINGITTARYMALHFTCNPEKFRKAASLMKGMLFDSRWSDEDLEKEKRIVTAELREKSSPWSDFSDIKHMIFEDFPECLAGDETEINEISLSDLNTARDLLYASGEKHIFLEGKYSTDDYEYFSNLWQEAGYCFDSSAASRPAAEKAQKACERIQINRRKYCDIVITFRFSRQKISHEHAEIIKSIMFDGLTSKAHLALREELGYLYSIDTDLSYHGRDGLLIISFETADKTSMTASIIWMTEALKNFSVSLTPLDLDCSLPFYTDYLTQLTDDNYGLISNHIDDLFNFEKILTLKEKHSIFSAVTLDKLKSASEKLFTKDNLYVLLNGNFRKKDKKKILSAFDSL